MKRMSRGLGRLQRDILASLDTAKNQQHYYHGGNGDELHPGWLIVQRAVVRIPGDVYDLRASARFLAREQGALGDVVKEIVPAFRSAFSRAVGSLLRDGDLTAVSMLPVEACERDRQQTVQLLADGDYIVLHSRQTRFVRKGKR